ncbi:TolC family outer membrane protein [Astrobacterium formosum]|uniref:TolC family outer membrane protein n=1 Tax=Astrobacterium formosum TaxID=3069710 RepID=UPI003F4F485D
MQALTRLTAAALCCLAPLAPSSAQQAFTITDAIQQAVQTNPGVGEATANRRATESELRQSQGVLLPQIRLEASAGPEKLKRFINPAPVDNGDWQRGREGSVVIRQLLFDGFASLNKIWQQAARVDAAAARVHERTELIALDAAEAYIDVTRYTRLVALAQENLAAHRRILSNVQARYSGGRSGEGDLQQAQERVSSAEAVLAEFRASLEDARAKYRKSVGLEPFNLRFPGRLPDMPPGKDEALTVALQYNPTIRAAQADVEAARYNFRSTSGAFVPNVSLEGRVGRGADSVTYDGWRNEASGKVVVSWDIFRGGQDSWKRAEAADRMTEQTMRHARLQREAFEALDKAWAARTVTAERAAALGREVEHARRVVAAYAKEYELGQRTLIDLLNSQNQFFNATVSLVSTRGVTVFADYQLLAAMGQLLVYLKQPHPIEAEPLESRPFGIFPVKLPPVLLHDPAPGPEPLKAGDATPMTVLGYAPVDLPEAPGFSDRWVQREGSPRTSLIDMVLPLHSPAQPNVVTDRFWSSATQPSFVPTMAMALPADWAGAKEKR